MNQRIFYAIEPGYWLPEGDFIAIMCASRSLKLHTLKDILKHFSAVIIIIFPI